MKRHTITLSILFSFSLHASHHNPLFVYETLNEEIDEISNEISLQSLEFSEKFILRKELFIQKLHKKIKSNLENASYLFHDDTISKELKNFLENIMQNVTNIQIHKNKYDILFLSQTHREITEKYFRAINLEYDKMINFLIPSKMCGPIAKEEKEEIKQTFINQTVVFTTDLINEIVNTFPQKIHLHAQKKASLAYCANLIYKKEWEQFFAGTYSH